MQGASKLKLAFVGRMNKANLTSKAIDLILALAKMQDNKGRVWGVYYLDICKELQISIQTYYDLLAQLCNAGLIRWEKNTRYDRDIWLVGNDFSYEGALHEGYMNIARSFLFSDGFRKLKARAKLLALDCLRISETNHNKSFRIGSEKFFCRYKELLGASVRSLQVYLKELKQFFSVCLKDKMYYITPKAETRNRIDGSEHSRCYEQIVHAACHRERIACEDKDSAEAVLDICKLFDTYKFMVTEKARSLADYILCAIRDSIVLYNRNVSHKKDWDRALKPKFVHKLLRESLAKDGQLA